MPSVSQGKASFRVRQPISSLILHRIEVDMVENLMADIDFGSFNPYSATGRTCILITRSSNE